MSVIDRLRQKCGIRLLFRIAILLVVVGAFLTLTHISYNNVTNSELHRAEESMRGELDYLCHQLEGPNTPAARDAAQGLLRGYTVEDDGVVVVIDHDTVVASDDERLPMGSSAGELMGGALMSALEESLTTGQLQRSSFSGVYEGVENTGVFGDDAAYVLAEKEGGLTLAILRPSRMVFANRDAIMGRETFVSMCILTVACLIVDRLLELMVLRRIDRTNDVLERITEGDLEARVESKGTREFTSLAAGINSTVEALQGWIAEAEARIDAELAAARAIQEAALPKDFSAYDDYTAFDVYASMHAAREVGGDFYDFFLIGEGTPEAGKLAFLIADVSGKGIPAALFMMRAMTQVRRELQEGRPISVAVENANRQLSEGNDACMFVTLWAGVLDYGAGRIEYVNAGHNPPMLYQQGSGWRWLREKSGMPLGFYRGKPYKTFSIDCKPGDKILLYTDGVNEATNGEKEMFGNERLEATCVEATAEHPQGLIDAMSYAVTAFVGDAPQFDDITMLALEVRR